MNEPEQKLSDVSDEELIKLVATGDKTSLSTLVDRHMKGLYSWSFRMCLNQNDAEDIVQETLLRVWQKAGQWDDSKGAAVKTWIYKIAYNYWIDLKRKPASVDLDKVAEPVDGTASADKQMEEKQIKEKVKELVMTLPDNQREALILCHYEGFTNAQAAEILETTVKAVESLLVRSRKMLREKLKQIAI